MRSQLESLNFFVASHHGRESSYCAEALRYRRHPSLMIVSDESIEYDTQDVDYGRHVDHGFVVHGTTRSVLTTRKDGCIRIYQAGDALGPIVTTENR